MGAERWISINGLHISDTAHNRARQLLLDLGYTGVRSSLCLPSVKPIGPGDTPDYSRIDAMALWCGQNNLGVTMMMNLAPWPWGTDKAVNFGASGVWNVAGSWYTLFPSSGADCWGASTSPGAGTGAAAAVDILSDATSSLTNYRASAVDEYGSYPRFRWPTSADDAIIANANATMARFMAQYVAAGGSNVVIFEAGNEMDRGPATANSLMDLRAVNFFNYAASRWVVPTGAFLATNACMGNISPPKATLDAEAALLKASIDHISSGAYEINFDPFTYFNQHAYLSPGVQGPRAELEYFGLAASLVEHVKTKPNMSHMTSIITEWGHSSAQLGVGSYTSRGRFLANMEHRFDNLDIFMHAMWTMGPDDNYGLLTLAGEPGGTIKELRRSRALPLVNGSDREPTTDRSYVFHAVEPAEVA